ncbi:hypothetical protein RND71_012528 [Anisodus tanguticus]|uniref:Uncharacterized protein n=1 Tax=Anisodus tanguticus TaxID=243964 RepID=A0AAE1SH77_9SOLA|nr:hypothetical protein RND71_012528 [Anisodus tanguticus]
MSSEQPSARPAVSRPIAQPKITSDEGRRKSARVEQPSSSAQMSAASDSSNAPKAPASSGDKFSREDSMKKASHVHPKLPDYDDIASKLASPRMNSKLAENGLAEWAALFNKMCERFSTTMVVELTQR